MKEAKDCRSIDEIRDCIDEIDYQVIASFGKRLEYVKEIVKYKNDAAGIVARDRQSEVFQKRREWAQEFGLNPDLFEEMYKLLVNWNVQKELEIFKSNNTENINQI
jgi:isochorismate pyruvate lyase